MGKISIQELANVLIERKKMNRRDASLFVSAMFDIVQQRLETDKLVKIKGLGTFKIIDVEDRESVNVNTGERVLIEGHGKITFAPDALLKELVNKPFAQFETVVLNDGVDFDDVDTTTTDAPEPEIESEPVVETEPVVEPEPVVPEPIVTSEPEPVIEPEPQTDVDDDHSSLPLVDFGGNDEPAVEPEGEPVEEPEDEPEDEVEDEFDDDINDELEDELEPEMTVRPEVSYSPEATTIRPEATTVRPEVLVSAPEIESELDVELEPEMEAKMMGSDPKIIEEISDEDIPEWVIEPYVASPAEEPKVDPEPIAEPEPVVAPEPEPIVAPEPVAQPVVETPRPAANSNLQSILSSFQTIKKPAPAPAPAPEPAPEPEPEPAPVVIPEPEPMVVPEPEPVVVPELEPEPMVVPEPEPEPVYVPEPEPVVVPEPEPVVEEHKMTADEELAAAFKNVDDAETIVSEPEDDDTEADEPEFETTRTRKSSGKWILALLACIVGLGGGYLLGNYYPYANFLPVEGSETVIHVQKEVTTEPQTEHAIDEVTEEAPIEQQASETDTKEAEAKAAEEAKAAKAKAEADAKAQAEAAAKAKADAESKTKTVSDKYDAMDVRVRLGAYRIVGTDKTVKVKEGEDLVKISRRYLGPDMECYLEVYNNIKASTPLKVGQEIKIPKLEWKKKKKTATAN